MRNPAYLTIRVLGLALIVGGAMAAPAAASTISIVGGIEEVIDLPCVPCRPAGFAGIPLGTSGYAAQSCPLDQLPLIPMSLVLDRAALVRFTSLGLDTMYHNQFYVDQNGDGDPFNDPVVFDFPTWTNEHVPLRAPVVLALPAGTIYFGYRYNVDVGIFEVTGYPSTTFNVFASCLPQAGVTNPRTCTEGYLGLADGDVLWANDDHQDLGLRFQVVPEPTSLVLTAIGLIGVIGLVRRRRNSAA